MMKKKKRVSPLGANRVIDYKDIELLRTFITEHGKIKARRSTNLTIRQQRQLSKSIKRARALNLLSFTGNDN